MSISALQGSLDGIGLTPLLRFLAELKITGVLRITGERSSAAIGIADGRVVGASFERAHGEAALDAIAIALPRGDFSLTVGVAALDPIIVHVELQRAAA